MFDKKYDDEIQDIWNEAPYCHCIKSDHSDSHRLCCICYKTINYTSHESTLNKREGVLDAWNINYITPILNGGSNNTFNKQAVHLNCNNEKK